MMHYKNEKEFTRGVKQKGMNLDKGRNTKTARGPACCVHILKDCIVLVGSLTAPGCLL